MCEETREGRWTVRTKRERDRARELHAIKITSSKPQLGYMSYS